MSVSPPRWNEVAAVFGGTFDPPHLGHREAALGLFRNPGVGRVLIVPSPIPPHKPSYATPEVRVEMARRCFPAEVRMDLRELERARRTPSQPTYSIDTLEELRREHPSLAFVIGTDQLEKLPTWHRFPDLLDVCHWIVLERKPDGEATARDILRHWEAAGLARSQPGGGDRLWKIGKKHGYLILAPTDAPRISSTQVREEIGKTGLPPENLLHPDVSAYLKQLHLYGSKG